MKRIMIATLAMLIAAPAFAQEAAPRGWTKGIDQASCTSAKGLKWVEADEFTSAKTGKVRKQSAGCRVDSKAAAFILYKMHASK